jgi:hypothetical protein
MTDVASLHQVVQQAWVDAFRARQYSRAARARATLTMQEVRRASHHASVAWLGLSMPKANAWTLAITATILARYGLLDEKPFSRSPAEITRGAAMPLRPTKGRGR